MENFTRFFTTGGPYTGTIGTGIGLAFTQQMSMLNGSISAV